MTVYGIDRSNGFFYSQTVNLLLLLLLLNDADNI